MWQLASGRAKSCYLEALLATPRAPLVQSSLLAVPVLKVPSSAVPFRCSAALAVLTPSVVRPRLVLRMVQAVET
jgi:hypothetical protein